MKKIRSASWMAISVCARMRPCSVAAAASSKPAVSITSKSQVVELGGVDAAVAGDARRVVDERQLPAGQPIEQRRFADVGPADDGDFEAHVAGTMRAGAADQLGHQGRALARVARGAVVGGDLVEQFQRVLAALPSFQAARPSASRAAVAQRVGVGGQRLDAAATRRR